MIEYNIVKGDLYNDLDCSFNPNENKIDVYTSVYWNAETKEQYEIYEKIINDFFYEDELIKAVAWCDISGFEYFNKQNEDNYVSIDVYLKKSVDSYTQSEIKTISDLISKWDEMFYNKILME